MSKKLDQVQLVIGAVQFGMNYGINNSVGKPSTEVIRQILEDAYHNNITEIDTAQAYGDSEESIYRALKENTKKYRIHSKFLLKGENNISQVEASLAQSIKNLGVDRLGYFFFHDFNEFDCVRNKSFNSDLINQQSMGLGVSLYHLDELKKAIDTPWVKAIQLPVNLFDCSEEKLKLLSLAKVRGQKIYCRSVFLQGLFFKDIETLPLVLQPLKQSLKQLHKISNEHEVPISDLALGYVKSIDNLQGLLIGVDTVLQLQQNIKSFNAELSVDVLNQLKNIDVQDQAHLLHPKNWNAI